MSCRRRADPYFVKQPSGGSFEAAVEPAFDFEAQARDRRGQFVRAAGRLAQPERNRGWLAVSVFDAHGAALDAQDPIGDVAELKDVALQALDGEIFVDGADKLRLRLQHDSVVRGIRDRPAGGQSRESGAAAPANHVVHGVVIDESAVPAPPGGIALGEHA